MKETNFKPLRYFILSVSLASFLLNLKYSYSDKSILIKKNIEAISETTNSGDFEGAITRKICFAGTKDETGSKVYQCHINTTTWPQSQVEPGEPPFIIRECDEIENKTNKTNSRWGFCYIPKPS